MKDRESLPEGKIQPEADSPTKLVREGSTDLKGGKRRLAIMGSKRTSGPEIEAIPNILPIMLI